jgi:amino acid permease
MKIIYAISVLVGTIIGVGIFALPYITLKVGLWVMLGYFLILGSLVVLIHSFFGELALKTPDLKRLPGFAKIYLGKKGEFLAYLLLILGILGALLAYLIVGGEFLAQLFSLFFETKLNQTIFIIFYFLLGSLLIFFGIKPIARIELGSIFLFVLILFLVFLKGKDLINFQNLFPQPDWSFLFLPYGAVIFSLWGTALIPEIEEVLGERKKFLKLVIFSSILISAIIYLFFIYLVLGISGFQTSENALTGLKGILDKNSLALLFLFGILTTFTSFITLGLTLKKVFWYDLKLRKGFAWLITSFSPLILYFLGFQRFIAVISLTGGITIALEGILILLMYQKIRPERRILTYFLMLILFFGIIYSIIYFSK